jgi:EpsI family protein
MQTAIIAIVCLAVGVVSWHLLLRPSLEIDTSRLEELPLEIGQWKGIDLEMQSGIEKMLDADFHLQRAYRHSLAGIVWFYVGYYGTQRGGRPEHTPWVCYPSNGWDIERSQVVNVQNREVGRVNELLVERDGERRLVHFWYQSHRRSGMLGDVDQALDRLIGRLGSGRADGSLVRLSVPVRSPEDSSTARLQLIEFGREVAPLLRRHWPSELEPS